MAWTDNLFKTRRQLFQKMNLIIKSCFLYTKLGSNIVAAI